MLGGSIVAVEGREKREPDVERQKHDGARPDKVMQVWKTRLTTVYDSVNRNQRSEREYPRFRTQRKHEPWNKGSQQHFLTWNPTCSRGETKDDRLLSRHLGKPNSTWNGSADDSCLFDGALCLRSSLDDASLPPFFLLSLCCVGKKRRPLA